MVIEKLDALAVAKAIGDLPQNINFAIKQTTATAFLDSIGVKYASGGRVAQLEATSIYARARNQAVYIECKQ